MTTDPWIIRARQLLTMTGWSTKRPLAPDAGPEAIRHRDAGIVGLIDDGAVLVEGDTIGWVGAYADRPSGVDAALNVPLAMPAWVDCHTHALFAGRRAGEFASRNAGVPYVQVLERGGGILSTVRATREAPDEALVSALTRRLEGFAARGVGTVEVKTGYGLSLSEELRHLRLIAEAAQSTSSRVVPTFLGAHAIPKAWREDVEGYVDLVIEDMLPRVAEQGIAESCDVFCDRGAFTLEQSRRILAAARGHGLAIRIHAEELTFTGGAAMAASMGALSADHCDHLDEEGIATLISTGCVGVLLPGVTIFLDVDARPPARQLVDGGGQIALSTDFNPGSSMTQDLALMTTLGCTLLKLTPGEALWGITAGAAAALGRDESLGQLMAGRPADIACFDAGDYYDIPYEFGHNVATHLFVGGHGGSLPHKDRATQTS